MLEKREDLKCLLDKDLVCKIPVKVYEVNLKPKIDVTARDYKEKPSDYDRKLIGYQNAPAKWCQVCQLSSINDTLHKFFNDRILATISEKEIKAIIEAVKKAE